MTEDQYHQICEACDEVLQIPEKSLVKVAIPWLHVIREHPVFLARYEVLFNSEKLLRNSSKRIKSLFLSQALWYQQIFKAIKLNGELWFGSDILPEKVDCLFISYLLNAKQYNQKEDFYFGNLPAELIKKKRSVVVASISHFRGHSSSFRKNFVKGEVPRLFFSESSSLSDELKIRSMTVNGSRHLKELAKNEPRPLFKRILFKASDEVLSKGTRGNLRLGIQIEGLVQKLNPKVIVIPYEGHAHERIVFASARKANPSIKCVAYQHTGVFRLSNAVRRTLNPAFNPDIILTSGANGKIALETASALKGIPIMILGSERGVASNELTSPKWVNAKPHVCLVIPEGLDFECMFLFRFSILCAKERPDITFIWRLHPTVSFEKLRMDNVEFNDLPVNIVLSNDTIENDIARCSWALYRGTTAIYKAISEGLRPLYLRSIPELTIDPLYEMSDWRIIIDTPQDFFGCIDNDIKNDMYFHKINLKMAREVCEKQFAKINVDLLNDLIPLEDAFY